MVNVIITKCAKKKYHKGAVRVLEGGVRSENRVVWLYDRVGECRRRVNAKLKLALLAIICREPLKDECAKTGSCATTEGVENEEALKASAVVSQTSDPVHYIVDLLLPNRVVASCI
jgi:hypothetical protein